MTGHMLKNEQKAVVSVLLRSYDLMKMKMKQHWSWVEKALLIRKSVYPIMFHYAVSHLKCISFYLKINFIFLSPSHILSWWSIESSLWLFANIYFLCLGFTRFCVSQLSALQNCQRVWTSCLRLTDTVKIILDITYCHKLLWWALITRLNIRIFIYDVCEMTKRLAFFICSGQPFHTTYYH